MIGRGVLERLPSCEDGCETRETPCEMRTALLYLESRSENYGGFTPALSPVTKPDPLKGFLALIMPMMLPSGSEMPSMITRVDVATEHGESTSGPMTTSALHSFLKMKILTRSTSGSLLVTVGKDLGVLDTFLEQFGPFLCDEGYTIEPRLSGSSVSYLRISKRGGRESWSLVYAETMSGVKVSTFLGYAKDAGYHAGSARPSLARLVYGATDAYQSLLLETFGTALCPTVGMIALRCVRHCLPSVSRGKDGHQSFRKWRPDPLLVAMERIGKGYRGGITYAQRYRGPTTRVDVIRQYTAALTTPLPYKSAFGRWRGPDDNGIFLCSVRFNNPVTYPLGVWDASARRFRVGTHWESAHMCASCILANSPDSKLTERLSLPGMGFAIRIRLRLQGTCNVFSLYWIFTATRVISRSSSNLSETMSMGSSGKIPIEKS